MLERVIVGIVAFLSSCAATPGVGLAGFSRFDGDPETVGREVLDEVTRMHARIEDLEPLQARVVHRKLFEVYLALGSEPVLERGDLLELRESPNLFTYPRITFPAIVEPNGSMADQTERILPVLVNPIALSWSLSKLKRQGRSAIEDFEERASAIDADRLADKVVFVLVPLEKLVPPGRLVPPGKDEGQLKVLERSLPVNQALLRPAPRAQGGEGAPAVGYRPRNDALPLAFDVSQVKPGTYRLVALPRLRWSGGEGDSPSLAETLIGGAWAAVPVELERLLEEPDGARRLVRLAGELVALAPHYFEPEMERFRDVLLELARQDRGSCSLQSIEKQMWEALIDYRSAVPVRVEREPEKGELASAEFSFVVAADLQYDTDISAVRRFLQLLDPSMAASDPAATRAPDLPPGLAERLTKVAFVLLAGDLGDGKGLSSSPMDSVFAGFGFNRPVSPYLRDGEGALPGGEFPELGHELLRCSKLVFAVPGNHDGFTNYGGVLNHPFRMLGRGLQVTGLPGIARLGHFLAETVARVPCSLARLPMFSLSPFFDGLEEYRLVLGNRNLFFHYRGYQFVGLNSFDLKSRERDAFGPLANSWGGGIQDERLHWFQAVVEHYPTCPLSLPGAGQFVFMHHDPRGANPASSSYEEADFGHYDSIHAPLNDVTGGWFGLAWSSSPLQFWIPVISPLVNYSGRYLAYGGGGFQQEWMREYAGDEDSYNAYGLVKCINESLGSIEALFLGHDDTPDLGSWVHPSGAVFPGQGPGNLRDRAFVNAFLRMQSSRGPEWTDDILPTSPNASVVRLDDIGQADSYHGFTLVTVTPSSKEGSKPEIRYEWIPVSR